MESVAGKFTDKFWVVSSGCRRKANLSFFMPSYYTLFSKQFISLNDTHFSPYTLSKLFFFFLVLLLNYFIMCAYQINDACAAVRLLAAKRSSFKLYRQIFLQTRVVYNIKRNLSLKIFTLIKANCFRFLFLVCPFKFLLLYWEMCSTRRREVVSEWLHGTPVGVKPQQSFLMPSVEHKVLR